jgi:hypothetical protein
MSKTRLCPYSEVYIVKTVPDTSNAQSKYYDAQKVLFRLSYHTNCPTVFLAVHMSIKYTESFTPNESPPLMALIEKYATDMDWSYEDQL